MAKTNERRKYARLDLALSVSYRVTDEANEPPPQEVLSSDISLGGIRLMTPSPLEQQTKLELEIFLPEDETHPIAAFGEVVWQTKISATSYETGVVIRGVKDEDKSRFMAFVFDRMAKLITP